MPVFMMHLNWALGWALMLLGLISGGLLGLFFEITILTAFPGTPLYSRLLKENRILEPGRWDLCTLFDVNFQPRQMSPRQLREGMYWLGERLYSAACTQERRTSFFRRRRARTFSLEPGERASSAPHDGQGGAKK